MGPCLNFVNSMVSRVGSGVYDYVPFFVLLSCGRCGRRCGGARARRRRGRGRPGPRASCARGPAPGAAGGSELHMCIGQTAGLQLITHALETDTHAHTSHTFTQPPAP